MAPIRVAHVVWRLSRTGGIQRLVRDLLAELDPEIVETSVVSVRPRYPEDDIPAVLDHRRFGTADFGGDAGRSHLPLALTRLTRAVRRIRPDILHLHSGTSWWGLPAALTMPSTARLLEVHDEPQSGRSGRANVAAMNLSATRLGFRVVTNSTVVRARTAEAFGVPPQDVGLISLGVDTDSFRPDPVLRARGRAALRLPDHVPVVVWVGRVEPLKRPADAVDVARRTLTEHPDAVFAIAGGGRQESELRAATASLPSVRVLGAVDDLPALLNAADVYLATSSYEGFGLSVAEAMACGLPVVTTRAGGVVDVVDVPSTGGMVDVGDVAGLAGHVASFLADAGRRSAAGRAARQRAQRLFSRPAMARRYEAEYEALVTARRRQG